MRVACFCGVSFESRAEIALCPCCRRESVMPRVTDRDRAEMALDLYSLFDQQERA